LTPTKANATTLPVKRTVGYASSTPLTRYVPLSDGLLIDTSGIGFSTPTVTISRVLVVKRNKKVAASSIIAAAGVASAARFGKATIAVTKKSGMKRVGSKYVFSKARTVKVIVTYKSMKKSATKRTVTVKVSR
jgi:hypothetical protein